MHQALAAAGTMTLQTGLVPILGALGLVERGLVTEEGGQWDTLPQHSHEGEKGTQVNLGVP